MIYPMIKAIDHEEFIKSKKGVINPAAINPSIQSEIKKVVPNFRVAVLRIAPFPKPCIALIIPCGYILNETKPRPIKFSTLIPAFKNFFPRLRSSSNSDLMLL